MSFQTRSKQPFFSINSFFNAEIMLIRKTFSISKFVTCWWAPLICILAYPAKSVYHILFPRENLSWYTYLQRDIFWCYPRGRQQATAIFTMCNRAIPVYKNGMSPFFADDLATGRSPLNFSRPSWNGGLTNDTFQIQKRTSQSRCPLFSCLSSQRRGCQ